MDNPDIGTYPTLTLTKGSPPTVKVGDWVYFDITGSVTDIDEEIPIEQDYAGSFGDYTSEVVIDNTIATDWTFNVEKSIIQSGEVTQLRAKLTDFDHRGVEGVRVDFYQVWTPSVVVKSDKQIIQSEDTANISAQLVDSQDGSKVEIEGQQIFFYKED